MSTGVHIMLVNAAAGHARIRNDLSRPALSRMRLSRRLPALLESMSGSPGLIADPPEA